MPVFPMDFESASEGGLIFAARKKKGRTVDPEDGMIAGIAKLNHETILINRT
jgi:predicted nucleic acid-binding protein